MASDRHDKQTTVDRRRAGDDQRPRGRVCESGSIDHAKAIGIRDAGAFVDIDASADAERVESVQVGEPFEMRLGDGVTLNGIGLRLVAIEDSRCPADVDCVRAGEVIVRLEARTDGGTTPTEVELRSEAGSPTDEADVDGFVISLLEVAPERTTADDTADSVTLRVGYAS